MSRCSFFFLSHSLVSTFLVFLPPPSSLPPLNTPTLGLTFPPSVRPSLLLFSVFSLSLSLFLLHRRCCEKSRFPPSPSPSDCIQKICILGIYHFGWRKPRMSSGRYMAYSPSPSTAPHSPHLAGFRSASSALSEQQKYLGELLSEQQKLDPFVPVLPHCYRILNQEILRVHTLLGNASFLDQSRLEHARPLHSGGFFSNGGTELNGWTPQYHSEFTSAPSKLLQVDMSCGGTQMPSLLQHSSTPSWLSSPSSSSGLIVKRTIRVDIPVDEYPNFNFVGRLLGPRGNSLKRVEAGTECRVLIRGRGSIKDPTKEEMMRGKPGYEHLDEPLHILVEGELPVEIIDSRLMQAKEILEELLRPVDESQDFFKKQQLRELAMINGTLREEGSHMSGSVSPFNSLGNNNIKRAKTRG